MENSKLQQIKSISSRINYERELLCNRINKDHLDPLYSILDKYQDLPCPQSTESPDLSPTHYASSHYSLTTECDERSGDSRASNRTVNEYEVIDNSSELSVIPTNPYSQLEGAYYVYEQETAIKTPDPDYCEPVVRRRVYKSDLVWKKTVDEVFTALIGCNLDQLIQKSKGPQPEKHIDMLCETIEELRKNYWNMKERCRSLEGLINSNRRSNK